MKKLFAVFMIMIVSVFSFTGCGNVGEAADEGEKILNEASESVSEKASEMIDSSDGDINDKTDDNGNVDNN